MYAEKHCYKRTNTGCSRDNGGCRGSQAAPPPPPPHTHTRLICCPATSLSAFCTGCRDSCRRQHFTFLAKWILDSMHVPKYSPCQHTQQAPPTPHPPPTPTPHPTHPNKHTVHPTPPCQTTAPTSMLALLSPPPRCCSMRSKLWSVADRHPR